VTNQTLDAAEKQLSLLGLAFIPDPVANPAVAEGIVYQTDPVAGAEVRPDDSIKLTYNPVAAEVAVPDVTTKSLADATAALQAQGFAVTSSTEANPTVPAGQVIRTDPAANTQAKQGSAVNIVVSGGPDKQTVPVTAGQAQADATNALQAAPYGFKVTVKEQASATVAAGTVIGTDPGANTSLAPGSAINLIVSSGKAKVAVPNVETLTEAAARTQLSNLGLQVSVTYTTVAFGSAEDGTVILQQTAEGTQVDPGTVIKLRVGKAVQPTTTTTTTTTAPPPTTTTIPATTTTTTTTKPPATTAPTTVTTTTPSTTP
ncbi:MAG: PASTA domain-containing protein, partial [Ilumatobacteraceae bacterium]